MYSLLLDSADKYLGIGIALNNEIIDKVYFEAWQRQSELMVPELEKILKKNNIDPKSINEIIVTVGPGSYTGVRIALTIAKIYAYSLNIKCYAISSLNILMNSNKPSICFTIFLILSLSFFNSFFVFSSWINPLGTLGNLKHKLSLTSETLWLKTNLLKLSV